MSKILHQQDNYDHFPDSFHSHNVIISIYTDGACKGNAASKASAKPTGWGCCIIRLAKNDQPSISNGGSLDSAYDVTDLDEICGHVVLDSQNPDFMDATSGTNNTAELSAIGKALLWLINCDWKRLCNSYTLPLIIIHSDSEYAAKSVMGLYKSKMNTKLITHISKLLSEVQTLYGGSDSVLFAKVKGHSDHIYNEKADLLANRGATGVTLQNNPNLMLAPPGHSRCQTCHKSFKNVASGNIRVHKCSPSTNLIDNLTLPPVESRVNDRVLRNEFVISKSYQLVNNRGNGYCFDEAFTQGYSNVMQKESGFSSVMAEFRNEMCSFAIENPNFLLAVSDGNTDSDCTLKTYCDNTFKNLSNYEYKSYWENMSISGTFAEETLIWLVAVKHQMTVQCWVLCDERLGHGEGSIQLNNIVGDTALSSGTINMLHTLGVGPEGRGSHFQFISHMETTTVSTGTDEAEADKEVSGRSGKRGKRGFNNKPSSKSGSSQESSLGLGPRSRGTFGLLSSSAGDVQVDSITFPVVESPTDPIPPHGVPPPPLPQVTSDRFHQCIVDIPWCELDILMSVDPSATFIPFNLRGAIRRTFNVLLERVRDDAESDLHWKRFLCLPTVLFTNSKKFGNSNRTSMKAKLKLILQDDWSQFSPSNLGLWIPANPLDSIPSLEKNHRKVTALATVGEIGKAMRTLDSQCCPPVDRDNNTFDSLQRLHPPAMNELPSFVEQFVPDTDCLISIPHDSDLCSSVIFKSHYKVTPGVDKLRNEHLRALLGTHDSVEEIKFKANLNWLIETILHNDLPMAVSRFLVVNEIIPIPKEDGGLRPVAIGETYRKIAAAVMINHLGDAPAKFLGDSNFGVLRNESGMEAIIHSVRLQLELSKLDFDFLFLDFINAFNKIDRSAFLACISEQFPDLFPYASLCYLSSSEIWLKVKDTVRSLSSDSGVHQGDVLGPLLFCLAVHPLFKEIIRIIGPDGFFRAFLDDGVIFTSLPKIMEILDFIERSGIQFGVSLNMDKSCIMMGRRLNSESSIADQASYLARGFSQDKVLIHSSNGDSVTDSIYGFKLLGTPIGSDAFISAWLSKKLVKLSLVADKIILYPCFQVRSLFLKLCFSQKITHLLRTINPALMGDFVHQFDILRLYILSSITDTKLDEYSAAWSQSLLPSTSGGLGLVNLQFSRHAAYTASVCSCYPRLKSLFGDNLVDQFYVPCPDSNLEITPINSPMFTSLHESLVVIQRYDVLGSPTTISDILLRSEDSRKLQKILSVNYESARVRHFKDTFCRTVERLSHFESVSTPYAGLFASAIPKSSDFQMEDHIFSIAVCRRLFIPLKCIPKSLSCVCKRSQGKSCDLYGVHLSTACGCGGFRNKTHDNINFVLERCCRSNGYRVIREELGAFKDTHPDSNKRPDLTVFGVPGFQRSKLILDATVVGHHNIGPLEKVSPSKAIDIAIKRKNTTYGLISSTNNLDFLPLVFESGGNLSDDVVKILKALLQGGDSFVRKSLDHCLAFWLTRLSVCLQSSLAMAIYTRARSYSAKSDRLNFADKDTSFIREFRSYRV